MISVRPSRSRTTEDRIMELRNDLLIHIASLSVDITIIPHPAAVDTPFVQSFPFFLHCGRVLRRSETTTPRYACHRAAVRDFIKSGHIRRESADQTVIHQNDETDACRTGLDKCKRHSTLVGCRLLLCLQWISGNTRCVLKEQHIPVMLYTYCQT